jgi:isoleucyl-tRNA synthetase
MTEKTPFEAVPQELDFPKYEQRILSLWKERRIFEKSLVHRGPDAKHFVFYEGPPTANGLPHNGHVLTRVVKDLFPRFQSMRGCRVLRKGGWDTHGLPVEVEVEKELRIHGKQDIEKYGVEPFVERCIESVFRYTSEWERATERLGFWVDLDMAYVTYHRSFVESVWWALSRLFEKGLLYQGHKVVWWWAQGGTVLSAAEVGLGYKSVDDPSVYVGFPFEDDPKTALVVWTTTPWTLLSNGYAAVHPELDYVVARLGEPLESKGKREPAATSFDNVVVARELLAGIQEKLGRKLEVTGPLKGSALVGRRYVSPFDTYYRDRAGFTAELKDGGQTPTWWRVIGEQFVTLDAGTGIVHVAPAFGEDDHNAHRRQLARYRNPDAIDLMCAVRSDGTFSEEAGPYAGRWIKDADRDIIRELRDRGLLLHDELYRHDYPFCWRADEDPLIQMARPAWFVRTTAEIEHTKANNRAINWLPEHIKEGRFGDFLENNVDWALSRERYWGTPLNVWICDRDTAHKRAPASVAEIERLNPNAFDHWRAAKAKKPELNDHLIVHKPWIDQVTFPCAECGGTMRRVPEVIDCWFDSGCMPFAQWGFPHLQGSKERFDDAFPADFISEAIDQTRGWFHSLLQVSTLVFDEGTQKQIGLSKVAQYPHPYRTCIVLGHVCDKEGKKESKSKGNYTPPEVILDRVAMAFGVLEAACGAAAKPREVLIAREDLEGMDVAEGAEMLVYREGRRDEARRLVIKPLKGVPRRVAVLSADDRLALGVVPVSTGLSTKPVEVPRVPENQRVVIEDPATPAPGADAFRWFFYASSPPWNNTRHSLRNVRMLQKDFVVKLRNVYSFFVIYANIDGWSPTDPSHAAAPPAERSVLDRWMLSELALAAQKVEQSLDGFLAYDAAGRLVELAEALSNWYVRRSRTRFYGEGLADVDKRNAYGTLYEVLVTLSKLIAPFVPFFAEELYQNLVVRAGAPGARESVHLEDYPKADESRVARALAQEMAVVRDIVSLGLSARTANKLKVRQPLGRVDVVLNDGSLKDRVAAYTPLVEEELNVHDVRLMHPGHEEGAVTYRLKPNFRALGPRLGKRVQEVKKALGGADGAKLHAELAQTGGIDVTLGDGDTVRLSGEDIEVAVHAAEGFAAETGAVGVVVLHTTLTPELIDEGLLREVVSRVQAARKDMGLEFTDRIRLSLGGSERVVRVAREGEAHIRLECLATEVSFGGEAGVAHEIGEEALRVGVERV